MNHETPMMCLMNCHVDRFRTNIISIEEMWADILTDIEDVLQCRLDIKPGDESNNESKDIENYARKRLICA